MNKKQTILFIDDDRHLTRSMNDFLRYEGFEVTTAPSAEAALKALEETKPDLIILDISMPGMGGIGFLKHVSKDDGTLLYPVLVLTARAAMNAFFNMLAVDGFLPKPCSEQELLLKIQAILARKQKIITPTRRLLLGEDDHLLTRNYVQSFNAAGFETKTVAAGPEMLEQAVSLAPDLILIKEVFPGMNGSAVSRLLKSIPKTADIPIILYDETRETGCAPQHKADLYIDAPTFEDLLHAVQQFL